MKDLFGKAILDFQTNNYPEDLITETSISEADEMSVAYLFRTYEQMPKLEQKALELAKGKILDVGCGAGSHSLFLQNEINLDVTSIYISPKAIKACELRGLKKTRIQNVVAIEKEKFDTILLLMNGTGVFGTLKQTPKFLQKLKSLLNPNGQILIDSSDIIYMFDDDSDLRKSINVKGYYGELTFTILYKNETEDPFPWLYLDYNTLYNVALDNDLQCELILEGEHYDYLAKMYF
ncbi:MAG TPA: SAM-dependent methyltransferase [Flavobacterium sp.]|nr:SAM-dependent methyltransferase [Flavobacterium sp.]